MTTSFFPSAPAPIRSRSDAPSPARASDGSLFARARAPQGKSRRRDWVLAMAVFGALLGLVAALRLHPMPGAELVAVEIALSTLIGAALGALLHRLDRRHHFRAPAERFVRVSGRPG